MLSEKTWSGEALARMVLGIIATALLAKMLWTTLAPFTESLPASDQKFLNMLLGTLSFQGAIFVWVAVFLRSQSLTWSHAFGFNHSSKPRAILMGLAAGILVVPSAWMLQHLTVTAMKALEFAPQSQEVVQTFQETAKATTGVELIRQRIIFGISVIIIAPVAEELLFRGLLYPTLKRMGHRQVALWGTSLLFAALHSNLPSMLPFILFAMVLLYLYEATDNLLAPIAAHSCFNGINFLMLLFEQQINRVITGT